MNDKIHQLQAEIELEKEKIAEEKHTKFLEAMRKQSEEEEKFRVELLEEYGVTNHPKAGLVYSMAWERGHSSGYDSVRQEFEELVELIK